MGLLNRFRKSSNVDDEDADDDEITDEEEDEDEDDEEEAETAGGLFGKIRGLGGKLLGQGGDDDEDDDEEEDEDDYDESAAAPPSPPVQTVPKPSAETEAAPQNLTPSLAGVSLEEPASPSPISAEDLPASHEVLTGLTEEDPGGDSAGAPNQAGLTSEETPSEEDASSEVEMNLGGIFEKKVEIDQKLKSLAMSQEETPAEFLATELHDLLRELEELTPS